eukprot:UN01884
MRQIYISDDNGKDFSEIHYQVITTQNSSNHTNILFMNTNDLSSCVAASELV